jgi:hypothetical protein
MEFLATQLYSSRIQLIYENNHITTHYGIVLTVLLNKENLQ